MLKPVNEKNIERFNGFSGLYNDSRPIPPEIIIKSTLIYALKNPQIVVDIGCGTGLSTQIWKDTAQTIIGIDPNDEMREVAEKNVIADNISFRKGVSNDTGLPGDYADIVTVAQAFHWFDTDSSLPEIYRILKTDGILAIYDYDNPPSVDWVVEKAYLELWEKADVICLSQAKPAIMTDKSTIMNILNVFGKFRFVKEIACHKEEIYTPEKVIGIKLSQGYAQNALKFDPSFQREIDKFCDVVYSRLSGEFTIIQSYKIRLAVK